MVGFTGETCSGAQVDAVGFTSQDATIVTKIAYIADFTLSCSSGAKVCFRATILCSSVYIILYCAPQFIST